VTLPRGQLAAVLSVALVSCQPPSQAAVSPPAPAGEPVVKAAQPAVLATAPAEALQPGETAAVKAPASNTRPLPEDTRGKSQTPKLGQAELRQRFTPFPKAITPIISMGEQTIALQTPMTLAYFDTRASALEVLEFYDARKVVDHPAISATDPADDTQMTVMVVGSGSDGQPRTVILGLADVSPAARVPDDGDLPPYPGAMPLTMRSSERGSNAYTHSFVTPDSVKEVADFFRKRMPELGYAARAADTAPTDNLVALAWAKAGRRWTIRVHRQSNHTAVVALCAAEEVMQ
jgi:hypothetical protein